MAKKKAEGDDAEGEDAKKKKKPIIPIVVVLVLALVGAKMFILKTPAQTPAQVAAAKKAADTALYNKCALANDVKQIGDPLEAAKPPTGEPGKVLAPNDASVTVNLADGAYLKVGIALQLDAGIDAKVAKDDGLGDKATDLTLKALAKHTMGGLAPPSARNRVQQQLSFDVCRAYEGKVLSVYFTEFVMQGS